MRTEEKWQESIETFLSLILGEEEAEKFGDLSQSLAMLKQSPRCWQAPVSIGIHAAILYVHIQEDDAKSTLEGIIDFALEPLEACLEQIMPQSSEEGIEDERTRLLFHTRFSLGLLLLIKGILKSDIDTENRGISLLHEMAATKLSFSLRDYSMRSGPDIVKYYPDMGKVKTFAAVIMPFIYPYRERKNYTEILFFVTEALPYAEYWHAFLVQKSCKLLEDWTAYCDEYDKENLADDHPNLEWLDLFAAAAGILSACEEADSSGALPNECKKESAQYIAWVFGQIAGHFTLTDNVWHDNPFKYFQQFITGPPLFYDEAFEFVFGPERTAEAFNRILSLLSEYSPEQDLHKVRKRYIQLWEWSNSFTGSPLNEIGPHTDLYWAMKIGFADALLRRSAPLFDTNVIDSEVGSKMWSEINDILRAPRKVQRLSRKEILKLVESEESAVLEFKASIRWNYREKCLNDSLCLPVIKTIAAFLNGDGGRLLIGVGDDHDILGLDNDYKGLKGEHDPYRRFLVDKLCGYIGDVECAQYVSIEFYKIDTKDICLLDVKRSVRPVYVRDGGAEDFYIRVENETRRLNTKKAHEYMYLNFPRRFGQT